ncbi:Trypsin-1 [Gryllus bimaculatus]|nr:Trypsin-1 [Gryllus bimaculatus]
MLRALVASVLLVGCFGAHLRIARPRLDGRIVGGDPVDIKEFPYQLVFLYNGKHICGAAIISENYAITAAHCVDGKRGSGGFVTQAEKITAHPQYDYYTIDYDIAVVRVATPFPLGQEGIAAIPLADASPDAGSAITVSGWGTLRESGPLPDQLQAVDLQVVEHAECNRAYQLFGGVTPRMLCAGVPGGGKDACQGDSGGPLVAQGQLVGIWLCCAAAAPRGLLRRRPLLDQRIVGGQAVAIEDFPYQLSLEFFFLHSCGASVISPNWAITAAHCTDG